MKEWMMKMMLASLALAALWVAGEYVVTTLPAANEVTVCRLALDFSPRLGGEVTLKTRAVTWSNVVERVGDSTNGYEDVERVERTVVYEYPPTLMTLGVAEVRVLAGLTPEALGLSGTNTYQEITDAVIRAGMAGKGMAVIGGGLL